MAVLLATPPFAVSGYTGKEFNAAHIAERYGLFTLIVLGESVVAVGGSLVDSGFDLWTGVTAAPGFGVAAALWWISFDAVRRSSLTRQSLLRCFTWGYGHLLVFAGVAAAAVDVHLAAGAAHHEEPLSAMGRLLLFGGVVAFLLATAVIHASTIQGRDRILAGRLTALAVAAVLGALAAPWPAPLTVGSLLLVTAAVVALETLVGEGPGANALPQLGS